MAGRGFTIALLPLLVLFLDRRDWLRSMLTSDTEMDCFMWATFLHLNATVCCQMRAADLIASGTIDNRRHLS